MNSKFSTLCEKVGVSMPDQTKFVSKDVNTLLEEQISNELHGAYTYIALQGYFKKIGLDGFSSYFQKQSGEEIIHAQKIIEFLLDTGSEMTLSDIKAPEKALVADPKEAATIYLDLEKSVTKNWQDIYKKAEDTENFSLIHLCQWFLSEQIQEEDAAVKFHQKVSLAKDGNGLLILDQEFAKRV